MKFYYKQKKGKLKIKIEYREATEVSLHSVMLIA